MPFVILKVDWNEGANSWIIRLRRVKDGRVCQAQFSPEAFKAVRAHTMGQFLLHTWFGRAGVIDEAQPTP
jgi:hypothetical protein